MDSGSSEHVGSAEAGASGPAPAKAGRREWIGLAVIALPCAVYSMDLTVLNLALPALSEDLEPSSSQLLWIVDIYGFLVAGLLITMGTLGDRIGRRRLLLIGAAAFGAGSVLAALSTSAEMLIAARALLGVAGATLAPSTLSLIRNMFADPQERTFAIGVWITSFSGGAAIGPLVGGLLLQRFSWGSVFLIAVPVMALLLAVGPRLLPEYRDPEAGRLDLISAAASLVAVLAVIYGLKQIAQDGVGWTAAAAIAGGLAVGVAFVRRQGRLADPLIDLRLFRVPAFSGALTANTLGFFVNFGIAVFIAQYLQLVLGLSPLEAGLWTVPWAAGFIVGSMLTPVIVKRISPASAIAGGLVLAAFGFGLLAQVSGDSSLPTLVTGSVVLALGLAPVFTLAADLMVGAAPPERAGAAAGISETSSEFGGALGIAVLGVVGTALYRGEVADAVPAGVPSEAAEAARDSLGGAVAAEDGLAEPLAGALVDTASDAFTQALQLAATLSAAVLIAAAAVAWALLRRPGEGPEAREEPVPEAVRAVADRSPCLPAEVPDEARA
jgi:DHA2 family multidrug resistance protein-like MFS transporter